MRRKISWSLACALLCLVGCARHRYSGGSPLCNRTYDLCSEDVAPTLDYQALGQRAIEAEKAGDVSGTTAAYEQLVNKFSNERQRYARYLAKQSMIDESITQYEIYYADYPDQHDVLSKISELYAATGRMTESIDARETFLSNVPDVNLDTREKLLMLWRELGGPVAAEEHYLEIVKDENAPTERVVLAYLMLGDLAVNADDSTEARKQYALAVEKISPPQNKWQTRAHEILPEQFISQRWLGDAVEAYKKQPVPRLLMKLGDSLRRVGRGYEMLALYQEYLLSPLHKETELASEAVLYGNSELSRNLINEIISVGEGETVVEQLRVKIAEQPKDAYWRNSLAYLLFQMKRADEALQQFEELAKVTEQPSAGFYVSIAAFCRDAGRVDDAIRYYAKALKTDFTSEEIHRAAMSASMEMSEEMMKLKLKGNLLECLGDLYKQKEQWADAEGCFLALVHLEPQSGSAERARAILAEIWKLTGKENLFVKVLREQVAQTPR